MRIHLPLQPEHFKPQASAGPSSSPLVHIGGELVLIELQGELSWEGDRSGKVIGLLGLERPDKPTLHLGEHHLLHGKITNLQKPYAVIRRVCGDPVVTKNLDDEISDEDVDDVTPQKRPRDAGNAQDDEVDDDDEPPLFPPEPTTTPSHAGIRSSSPVYPPSAPRDYSSELDFSSPARWDATQDDDEEEEERRIAGEAKKRELTRRKEKRKREEKERTRHYEVVGVVRKKVVFALRPEPIVTATVLPD